MNDGRIPLWIDIVEKLTPVVVTLILGVIASGIGYFQYKTNRDKLRLDLFSKRLEAYEKLQEFFNEVLRHGCVRNSMLPLLLEARYKSRFLFGGEIETWFADLWDNAVQMMSLRHRLHGEDAVPVSPERTNIVEKESKLLGWMMEQMKSSSGRYAKYLQFK